MKYKIIKVEQSPISKDEVISIEMLIDNKRYEGLLIKKDGKTNNRSR